MRKPETPVGESNGSRYSVWKTIENTGRDKRQIYLSVLFSLFSLIRYILSHRVKFYSVMFIHKISTLVV